MKMGNSSKFNIICPICNGRENRFQKNISGFKLFKCLSCLGEFSWPMKSSVDYGKIGKEQGINFINTGGKSLRRNFTYSSLVTFLGFLKKGAILDIGAGSGIFIDYAHNLGFDTYAVDLSAGFLENFKRNCPFAKACISSGENFNFPAEWPNSFNIISVTDVLEHTENPLGVGKNIYKHLDKGSYFIGSLPNRNRYYYKFGKIIDDFVPKEHGGDNPPYHLTFWRRKTVAKFLKEIGFKNNYIFSGGLLWRKNIYIYGRRSKFLSAVIAVLYKNSARLPSSIINSIECFGTHIMFIARKGDNGEDLKKMGDSLKKSIYRKEIPFFVEGDIE